MTENEAKSCIQGKLDCMNKCDVFDCKNTDECDSCFFCYSQGNFGEQKKAFDMAIQALEEIQQYRAIGTVEELQALKEKNEPRKIKGKRFVEAICPWCESELFETYWAFGGIHHCSNCGSAIDWQ